MKQNVILVPIDATEQSIIGLTQSYNLARLTNSRIVLLSFDESNKKQIEKKLDELAKEAEGKATVPVETMVRSTKDVYEEINKVADILAPIFIVIGLVSKTSKNPLSGKSIYRMVRESKHPVITIRGKAHRDGCKTIVLPIDLSKESRQKVGKGIELAKIFHAEIRVLSVHNKTDEDSENKLLSYSNQVWKFIKAEGIQATIKSARGTNVSDLILNYSREVEADLIIIMSEEAENIKEMIVGTKAEKLINESDIPVLSIRPKVFKDTSVFSPF